MTLSMFGKHKTWSLGLVADQSTAEKTKKEENF